MERVLKLFLASVLLLAAVPAAAYEAHQSLNQFVIMNLQQKPQSILLGSVYDFQNFNAAQVFVVIPDAQMYNWDLRRAGDSLYVDIKREMDYVKVFGINDDRGVFLNNLRTGGNNKKLMAALDNANSAKDLNNVMSRSTVFNPIKLLDTVHLWQHANKGLGKFGIGGGGAGYVDFITGKNADIGAASVGADYKLTDSLRVYFGGHRGYLSAHDRINDFDGDFFGLKFVAEYEIAGFDIALGANWARANFDKVDVYQSKSKDISGDLIFINFDAGYKFEFGNVSVRPFAVANYSKNEILKTTESETGFGAGAEVGIKNRSGENYTFVRVVYESDYKEIGAISNLRFVEDKATVDLGVFKIWSDYGNFWKFKIGGTLEF